VKSFAPRICERGWCTHKTQVRNRFSSIGEVGHKQETSTEKQPGEPAQREAKISPKLEKRIFK
jgi:hypothetical protein